MISQRSFANVRMMLAFDLHISTLVN